MKEPIKYISKVEIKNLWGRYDLEWNLDPSVNILSGINGSGKSTVLDCIASILITGSIDSNILNEKISESTVKLNNSQKLTFKRIRDSIKNLENKAKTDKSLQTFLSKLKEVEGKEYRKINTIEFTVGAFENKGMTLSQLHDKLEISIISTFDQLIKQNTSPDEKVKTELDKDIFDLQKKYLDYQLNLGKKAFDIVSKNGKDAHNEVVEVKKLHNRFLEIIDMLFADTDKRVDRDNNELMFLSGKDKLTPYQLSSGEKQILVILLTVLVQDNKPSILFMDEPEISLHLDWQRKLIQYIKELNPNVQIILATHSPGIILEGWADKVSEMSDLITLDRQAKLENAK